MNIRLRLARKIRLDSPEYYSYYGKFDYYLATVTKGITGYKKVRSELGDVITFLHIPAGARLHFALHSTKLRASEAVVMGFSLPIKQAHSMHDHKFFYRPAHIVMPSNKFSEYYDICASGIHFFLDYNQASRFRM